VVRKILVPHWCPYHEDVRIVRDHRDLLLKDVTKLNDRRGVLKLVASDSEPLKDCLFVGHEDDVSVV
jgi:hypothetical protein